MILIKSISRKVIFPVAVNLLKIQKPILYLSKKKCIIINFHGVTNINGFKFNNRHLAVGEFEKLLIYFKNNFNVVPLSEIFQIKENKILPTKKTIALTFDDGYENNFSIALPLLKKYNIPATFYIISKGLSDNNYYVWPDIVDLIQRDVREDVILDVATFKYPGFFCDKLKKSLVDFLKSAGTKREKYITELSSKYPSWREIIKKYPQLIEIIRKDEFQKYSKEPLIEYGSHTHTHFNLEYLTDEECEYELSESKRIISEFTEKKPISLAFPDGSYSKKTLEICFNAGYKNLTAVDYKFNENNGQPGLLSRFTISNSTTYESNVIRLARQFDKYGF
jgi:peptidoglycan/xylan/chitin deacetylase (PgdA/CDA1 family)